MLSYAMLCYAMDMICYAMGVCGSVFSLCYFSSNIVLSYRKYVLSTISRFFL